MLLGLLLSALAAPVDELGDLERTVRNQTDEYFEVKERRSAVKKLAELGSEEAWELVLFALTDPEAMVADEAQIQLGGLKDAELVELVLGKEGLGAKGHLVAARAAEALGRVELELDAKELTKHVKHKEPGVRRMLLWSIERQGLAGRITGDVERSSCPSCSSCESATSCRTFARGRCSRSTRWRTSTRPGTRPRPC